MDYRFLVDSYETERIKVLSTWSTFRDEDLDIRPHRTDPRGRSVLEHMIHQVVSEDAWFRTMLGIDVTTNPVPSPEIRLEFLKKYAADSEARAKWLSKADSRWWETVVPFFERRRSRAWVLVRRIAHTAHHRGQQTTLLRMLNRDLYSTYGPTADTGGLPANSARTVYPYDNVERLLDGETAGGRKADLPQASGVAVTERPSTSGGKG